MISGIDPKVDYAFKHLLGRESTHAILIDVINKVLDLPPGRQVQEVELLNPFNPKEFLDDKLSILDIKARDQAGRLFNVEMQMISHRHYEKRILYYWSRLHQQQLREGQDYFELKPTISISFLDHVLFSNVPDYHLRFQILEKSHGFQFTENLDIHILELPKFTKIVDQLSSGLDIWLYFMRHAATMDLEGLPATLQQPLIVQALEELKMLSQTDIERERYEARRMWQLDYNTGMKGARIEGQEIGRKEGRQLGEKIGAIHLSERLLCQPETPADELAKLSPEELERLAITLQEKLADRLQSSRT